MIDFYCRVTNKEFRSCEKGEGLQQYHASRWITAGWGVFCIAVAGFANRMGSLIEAVNILGSLFYGVMLGIFLVAFYLKWIKGKAVFIAAVIAQIAVIVLFILDSYNITGIGFLWFNLIGAVLVIGMAMLLQRLKPAVVS